VWRNTVTTVRAIWDPIANFFTSLWNKVHNAVVGAWNKIKDWVSNKWQEIVDEAHRRYDPIIYWFQQLWDMVSNGVSNAWEGIKGWVSRGVDSVVNFIRGLPGRTRESISDMVQAGIDMIGGFLRGVDQMVGRVLDKVRNMAQDAVNTVKSWLGIASPSKVFAEIGMYLALGLGDGIEAHAEHAVKAADAMARKVSEAGAVAVNLQTGQAGRPVPGGAAAGTGLGGGTAGLGAAASIAPVTATSGTSVTVVNVTVPVQGSVIAERDLQQKLQTVVARYAGRNTGAGWTPAFS
jgi:phage-related protein